MNARRDGLRLLAAVVVVLAFIALAAMALAAEDPSFGRRPASAGLPVSVPALNAPAPAPVDTGADSVVELLAPLLEPVDAPGPAAPEPPAPAPAVPPPPAPPDDSPVAPIAACELGLPPAPPGGGVASLVPLVPFFGPFAPEAFAFLPAFEPALPLFGPLLVAGEAFFEAADPLLQALLPVVAQLEEAGFDALAPGYLPNRDAFLAAEAELAASLAPVVETLATAPGAGCLPAAEAMLTMFLT